MVTKTWRVYGREGHRQRASFDASARYDFSAPGAVRIIEVRNADLTGTNAYTEIAFTCSDAASCMAELLGQLSDGVFENCTTGKIEEVTV